MTGSGLTKAVTSLRVPARPTTRTRKVRSNVRKLRWTFPKWLWPIRKRANRRASVLRKRVSRRSAWPWSPGRPSMADKYAPRLKAVYDETIAKAMVEKFGYKNVMEVPRIEKIVLNMGVGEATQDKKKVTSAAEEMELIAGQKPVITQAKKSIAQFKLREEIGREQV